jgi:hypothetical protein
LQQGRDCGGYLIVLVRKPGKRFVERGKLAVARGILLQIVAHPFLEFKRYQSARRPHLSTLEPPRRLTPPCVPQRVSHPYRAPSTEHEQQKREREEYDNESEPGGEDHPLGIEHPF